MTKAKKAATKTAGKPAAPKSKGTAPPASTPAAKAAKPKKAAPAAPAAGWSETIRNAAKNKQSGPSWPGGGNVWTGKERAGAKDPQTMRRGKA